MSTPALLDELEVAGVRLTRVGDDLRYETRPGVSIVPYRERILAHKPALLSILRRDIPPAASTLTWHHVYQGPVEATVPPASWDGHVPEGCGAPPSCRVLGPCHYVTQHGRCWAEKGVP